MEQNPESDKQKGLMVVGTSVKTSHGNMMTNPRVIFEF